MSLEGVDPPQGNNEERALNRGGGFPILQLIPPQGIGSGGIIPPGVTEMLFEDDTIMLYEDSKIMSYEASIVPANWFDESFRRRIPIKINSGVVPSAQTNFPFLFNSILTALSNAQVAGQDIRFVSKDGTVIFNVEVQEIETTQGIDNFLTAWAKIPSIFDELEFFMYYDNPTALPPLPADQQAVWDDYFYVLHMNQIPVYGSPSILDSTIGGNNSTPTGTGNAVTQTNGKIGKALNFDGTDGFIAGPSPIDDSFYVSIWAKSNTVNWNASAFIFSSKDSNGVIFSPFQTDTMRYFIRDLGVSRIFIGDSIITDVNIFHKYGLQYDAVAEVAKLILDGVVTSTVNVDINRIFGIPNSVIGRDDNPIPTNFGNAVMGEATIRKAIVSDDFFTTEFNNQNDPDTPVTGFYSVGNQQILVPDNWFDVSFKHRIPITINSSVVPTAQTDFPFLFNSILEDLSNAKINGDDIRFVSENGDVIFDVEIQEIETTMGAANFLIAWSKIPTMDNDLKFFMYYNKPTADSLGTNQTVWDSNYKGVYHMNQTTFGAGSTKDSTSNVNDGTPIGSFSSVSGKIGNAVRLDTTSGIDLGNNVLDTMNAVGTISMWASIDDLGMGEPRFPIFHSLRAPAAKSWEVFFNTDIGPPKDLVMRFGDGGVLTIAVPSSQVDNGETHHYVFQWDQINGKVEIFLDGDLLGTKLVSWTAPSTVGIPVGIGNVVPTPLLVTSLIGFVDEAKFSEIIKTPEFIKTEFNNQNDPDGVGTGFYIVGPVETIQ